MKAVPVFRPAALTGLVLLVPLAMTIVDRGTPVGQGWHWSPSDFLVMSALLFGAGVAYELLARRLPTSSGRSAAALAILSLVVAIWIELAVGGVSQLMAWLTR